MKFLLSVSLLFIGLAGTAVSLQAAPILYNINFTGGTPPATSGSFTYDASQPTGSQFSNFIVVWEGDTFDLTGEANHPMVDGSGCAASPTSATYFAALSGTSECGANSALNWNGMVDPIVGPPTLDTFVICDATQTEQVGCIGGNGDYLYDGTDTTSAQTSYVSTAGKLTISAATVATPEPSTAYLILPSLVALAFVARRRNAVGKATR